MVSYGFSFVIAAGVITLPLDARQVFGLIGPGAQVEIIEARGELILVPYVPVRATADHKASHRRRLALHEWGAVLLNEALERGYVHLAARSSDRPPPGDPARWGWRDSIQPRGQLIGWADETMIWLDHTAAFATIEQLARDRGEPLGTTRRAFARALADRELLTVRIQATQRHFTVQRRIAGISRAVWELPASWITDVPADHAPG